MYIGLKMNCVDVIKSLEADNSRLAKEAIIRAEADCANKEFFSGVQLALDPLITFGVKKVAEQKGPGGPGLEWTIFTRALDGFRSREVTGNAAQEVLEALMAEATADQWNYWYRRILIKDLRCGVSEKTVNNVVKKDYPSYVVPVFTCQLAHDSANHEKKVVGKKQIEVKLDGVRVICILYKDKRPEVFSRNGKQFHNFEHIVDQLHNVVKTYGIAEDTVLDGEVMSSSFQDLMKQVHRKTNVQSDDAVFHVFDIISLSDFLAGGTSVPQHQRSQEIDDWVERHAPELPHVATLSWETVDLDTEEGQNRFKDINKQAIDGGYEGIMIKDPDAGYECKRSHAWLKLKPFIEVTLEVVDVEEGTGRNEGRLGAFICEGVDDERSIGVNCGSGFTDSDRDNFWDNRTEILGRQVEVRADAITKNQDGSYSLRFPRFKGFRGFEPGEKL
jgi:DNA ligase-1